MKVILFLVTTLFGIIRLLIFIISKYLEIIINISDTGNSSKIDTQKEHRDYWNKTGKYWTDRDKKRWYEE